MNEIYNSKEPPPLNVSRLEFEKRIKEKRKKASLIYKALRGAKNKDTKTSIGDSLSVDSKASEKEAEGYILDGLNSTSKAEKIKVIMLNRYLLQKLHQGQDDLHQMKYKEFKEH